MKTLQLAALIIGLALLVWLIYQTGFETLATYLQLLGWGSLIVLLLSAVRNGARAASWFFAIEPQHRRVGFFALTHIMLAGEAIKYLTATGPFLSEPAKAAMVRRQMPLLKGFSSVVVENLIYYLSVFLFMLAGLPALVWLEGVPARLKIAGYCGAIALTLMMLMTYLAIRKRWFAMARGVQLVSRFGRGNRLTALAVQVRELEENVYAFYEQRQPAFYLILWLNLSAHLLNIIEVYVILVCLRLPASVSAAFVIEAVTKVINLVFFFVPLRAGVYESGNALVLKALHMTAGAGVALALVRKLRALFWAGYGLGVIAWLTMKDKRSVRANDAAA